MATTATRRWARASVLVAALALLGSACTTDEPDPRGADGGPTTSLLGSGDTGGADGTEAPAPTDDAVVELDRLVPPDPDPTPLAVADDIRVGVLENGLTYYARENDAPGSSVSLRLVVRAGGLQEDPRGTGVAHFLEHMMFNGTERFPGNELDAALRSIGAEIGPDFNAYTSDTETVYKIAVADFGDNVDIAFDVVAQWASAATIDPDEVAAEAPIVREELRVRSESGDGLIFSAFEEVYFAGTPFEGVDVGGTAETISATTDAALRAYYDTWYRPDNMAIIAVGDRDVDDLERAIVDRFSALEARGQIIPPEVPDDFPLRTEPLVDVIIEPAFGDSFISVDYPVPSWDHGTVGGNELLITEIVLGQMINNRLVEGVDSGRLPLRRAFGGWFPHNRYLHYMGFNVDADDLVEGTEALMTEIRGSVLNGFDRGELDRAVDLMISFEEQRLAAAPTEQDEDLADQLVESYLSGTDLRGVRESVESNIAFMEGLDLDAVNDHWRWLITSSAPIVLVVGPDAERVGSAADHLAAVERAAVADVAAVTDDVVEISALMDSPEPVEEIARRDLARNDGFELEFANRMRVLFSPTEFIAENEVVLVSESPGGRSSLSGDDGAVAPVAAAAVEASGLGGHSALQVRRFLADADVGLSPYIDDTSEGFSGGAATEDVELLFQLLHLSVTEPAIEAIPFAQQVEFARDLVVDVGLDPSLAADVAVADARTGGDGFAAVPTLEQLEALTDTRALDIYRDRFRRLDDHVVVVVGDVDADTVIDLARRYVGTLPGRDGTERPSIPPPPGRVDVALDVGTGTATGAYRLLLSGRADETVAARVLAELATSVLNDRSFSVLREQLGATYGGRALIEFEEPGDGVELLVAVDGDPDRIDEIATAVSAELDSLAAGSITADDFDEAVAVLSTRYEFVSNGFIIESLFDEARRPDDQVIDRSRQIDALRAIDPDDLTAFVAALVQPGNRIEVRNIPAP